MPLRMFNMQSPCQLLNLLFLNETLFLLIKILIAPVNHTDIAISADLLATMIHNQISREFKAQIGCFDLIEVFQWDNFALASVKYYDVLWTQQNGDYEIRCASYMRRVARKFPIVIFANAWRTPVSRRAEPTSPDRHCRSEQSETAQTYALDWHDDETGQLRP